MPRPLPPLNALRAFEATARHLSFTLAADELSVTPAALSHQIKGLEDFLGQRLFDRKTRSIALTPAGLALYPGLHAAFLQIRQSVELIDRASADNVLVISAPPGFTAKWLVPRLYRFLMENPEIDARISATQTLANFTSDGVDLAIRNSRAVPNGHWSKRLLGISLIAVASPRLIAEHDIRKPGDLARVTLIHDDMLGRLTGLPTWSEWLAAAGVEGVNLARGLRLSSSDHALDAAVEGAGFLLAHKALAHDDLKTGRLVAPFGLELPTDRVFSLVCPEVNARRPKVRAFCDWALEEARRTEAGP
ncbi:MAG: transcriptional regulator GcvA [Hyphomicrobiaceae bacterium]|nr:transcriptional regulator GcvA [Hyphomicrobiaceae bacterium]